MGNDVTDIGPILKLVEIRRSDEKEYKEILKYVELITQDLINISLKLIEKQRKDNE